MPNAGQGCDANNQVIGLFQKVFQIVWRLKNQLKRKYSERNGGDRIMKKRRIWIQIVTAAATVFFWCIIAFPTFAQNDGAVLGWMDQINQKIPHGSNVAIGQIELYTAGRGTPVFRHLRNGFRFVPNDARRNAEGTLLRYMVDSSASSPVRGYTTSGLTAAQTEAAIGRAMNTWTSQICMRKVPFSKRYPMAGTDPDSVDYWLTGEGDPSNVVLFQADIVHGGWINLPAWLGDDILAITFTLFFTDQYGRPTDTDHDGYGDTAWTETYYNDIETYANGSVGVVPWAIDQELPYFDVESIALHESGHALGLDHFGPPPVAVMNSAYNGLQQTLLPTDRAGVCGLFSSWPN